MLGVLHITVSAPPPLQELLASCKSLYRAQSLSFFFSHQLVPRESHSCLGTGCHPKSNNNLDLKWTEKNEKFQRPLEKFYSRDMSSPSLFNWHQLFLTSVWWQRKMSIWICFFYFGESLTFDSGTPALNMTIKRIKLTV